MRKYLFWFVLLISCSDSEQKEQEVDLGFSQTHIPKALLASRFNSFNDFKKVVQIDYSKKIEKADTVEYSQVELSYITDGDTILSYLQNGISQDDIVEVRDGDIWDKLGLIVDSPYAISTREQLKEIYSMARRKPKMFGAGDVAFYDLALQAVSRIHTNNLAFKNRRDSSEKGYINTFNHVTAQALITTLYSEEIADFIADMHELHNMPQLTSGAFTQKQLGDTNNYPVDNYIDMINNELGQELGLWLKSKYKIEYHTRWTPKLLADYLNDLQDYYKWSFGIGVRPFEERDDVVVSFSKKLNKIQGITETI